MISMGYLGHKMGRKGGAECYMRLKQLCFICWVNETVSCPSLLPGQSWRHKDLRPLFGSQGLASEIINGKRTMSKAQAKKLGEFF